jgi:hypothetical protein
VAHPASSSAAWRQRLLRAAFDEWDAELHDDMRRLRGVPGGIVAALVDFMHALTDARRRTLAQGLARRAQAARGADDDERALLFVWDERRRLAPTRGPTGMGTNDLRLVSKLVEQELSRVAATACGPQAWEWSVPFASCRLETRVEAVAGWLTYHQDLVAHDGVALIHGLSYLSWLGVAPTTSWPLAAVSEARDASQAIVDLALRFQAAVVEI